MLFEKNSDQMIGEVELELSPRQDKTESSATETQQDTTKTSIKDYQF